MQFILAAAISAALVSLVAAKGVPVFQPNDAGVSCYRIPALAGTLVAFAEARHGSCSDGAVHEIAVSRSFDDGQTWDNVTFAVGNASYMVGNPTATYLSSTDQIVLVFVKHDPGCVGGCGRGNAVVFSGDEGKTWSKPSDVSKGFGAASGSLPGPGTALEASGGRVWVISHHGAYQRDYLSYSDDHGMTWATSDSTFPHMDEAAITELPDGELLVNMRHTASPAKGRAISRSTDGGMTWSPISYDPALISPVCQGSIVSFNNATYFSNPASRVGRNHISVRKSVDNARTWQPPFLVEAGSSAGYSCLAKGEVGRGSGKGGLLFEGEVGGTIMFGTFPL